MKFKQKILGLLLMLFVVLSFGFTKISAQQVVYRSVTFNSNGTYVISGGDYASLNVDLTSVDIWVIEKGSNAQMVKVNQINVLAASTKFSFESLGTNETIELKSDGTFVWNFPDPTPTSYRLDYYTNDQLSPVINGETNYITNVDNPVSIATIKSGLSAIDNIDGYIPSSQFVLVSDGYTDNAGTLGIYDVRYKVADSSGNEAFVTVKVHVVDVTKPTITGTSNYTTSYNQSIAITTITSGLSAVDNYDGPITPVLVTDNYSANAEIVGTHTITYKAVDSSGNESNIFTVNVKVEDKVKPVISGKNSYETSYNSKLAVNTIKNALSANDEYDGNLTTSITLKSDNYSANYNRKGAYQMVFTVKDSSNNSVDYTVNITVVDKIKPVISGQNLYTSGTQNKILESTVRAALSANDDYDGALTVELVEDNYSSKYQVPGEYTIKYKATDTSNNTTFYTVTIRVGDGVPPIIYTTDVFINIDGALNYTLEQIINHLVNVGQLEAGVNMLNYDVLESDYNSSKAGDYTVVLMRKESASVELQETITIGIRVLEATPLDPPSDGGNDQPLEDNPTWLDDLKEWWSKNRGLVIGLGIAFVVALIAVKVVNPSNKRRR